MFLLIITLFNSWIIILLNRCFTTTTIPDRFPEVDFISNINTRVKEAQNANHTDSDTLPTASDTEQNFIDALKSKNLSQEFVLSNWPGCIKSRADYIKAIKNIDEIFTEWPHYKNAYGYKLVTKSFEFPIS